MHQIAVMTAGTSQSIVFLKQLNFVPIRKERA